MKAAELVGVREFRLVEQELPAPGPGEVQVQVAGVGICGSDMHNYTEGGIGDSPCKYPMILGHEPAGLVIRSGSGVTGISPGDHFALEPAIPCGACEMCQRGRANLCNDMQFMSSGGIPGFFRERVNLPAHNLIPVPKHVGLRAATLVEPLAVALHSLSFARIEPGETVVVFGTGPIGLLTIAAAKFAGAGRVWAVEPVPHRRDMAKTMGADVVLDTTEPVRQILHDTAQRGVDVAFDCAAGADSVNQCIAALAKTGRLVYTAIPAHVHVPFHAPGLRKKEITFFNVYRSNHQTERARDILAENVSLFAPLVTHSRPLDEIQQAFETATQYADGVGKMLVVPSGD
ncbi:MAG TPA: alcohol dehydrogenase catalytic domain-containing protein [Bryobacteraceae bacterium]|nr:alcohol dehydrogenase catalytic domain-containing protein [Bryobacteraceae bacterium]